MFDYISSRLQQQQNNNAWRQLTSTIRQSATLIKADSQTLVNFSCNDYLSLGDDESLRVQRSEASSCYGLGSGGSSVVCGYDEEKARLSQEFADFIGAERTLFISSGYMANLAVLTAILDDSVDIYIDKLSHASIYDALAMKGLAFKRFHHNDMQHLEMLLSQSQRKYRFIISEGLFSMTGQKAKLDKLVALKKQYNAMLMVDDAHAIGVIGELGQGSVTSFSFEDIDIITCSLNKAFCHSGAMICAKNEVIESVIQFARPYLYSSALSSAHVASIYATFLEVKRSKHRRQKLQENINYFLQARKSIPYQWYSSSSPIHLLTLGCNTTAINLFSQLKSLGYYCYPMRQPTVSQKNVGLRIVLNSGHELEQINGLCRALGECTDVLG